MLLIGGLAFGLCGFEWEGRLSRLERELRTGDARQRREVVRLMGGYPADQVRDPLLAALEDDEPAVRREAAEAAGRVRLADAVPFLLEWLEDPDADVRAAAARSLGRIGDPRPLTSLVRALGDASADVRRAAVVALSDLGTPEVVVPLLGRLDDDDPEVRIEAAEALARLADDRAVVPLVGRARDESPEVRVAVYRALGALGDRRAVAAVIQSLRDENEAARLAAIASLGRLGDARATDPLVELLRARDARTGTAVVAALGGIGTERAIDAIVESLANQDVRQTASEVLVARPLAEDEAEDALALQLAEALRRAEAQAHAMAIAEVLRRRLDRRRAPSTAEAVLEALADGRGTTRVLLETLAATGEPEVLVPILEHLQSDDEAVQRASLDALRLYFEIHPPDGRAADPLLAVLGRVPQSQRVTVVRLLGEMRAARALPAIRPLLEHPEPALRLAAVQAIGAIGDPQGADALYRLLDDPDARTRFEAARALAEAASPPIVADLGARVVGSEAFDRHAGLVAIGGALAREDLEAPVTIADVLGRVSRGPDLRLAARAIDALARWASPDAQDRLRALARSGRPLVLRRQATRALDPTDATSRETLDELAADRDLAPAAAVALGEGDAASAPVLLRILDSGRWPAPGAAAFGIARLARRDHLGEQHVPAVCEALRTNRDAYLRANLIVALAALHTRCENAPPPESYMDRAHAPPVRGAAARWHAATDGDPSVLLRCRREELAPDVARACQDPSLPPLGKTADVYAYAADGTTLLRGALVALRLADGSALLAHTSANGQLRHGDAPRGGIALDDPLRMPLDP